MRMDWKTFVILLLGLLLANRDEVRRVAQDAKKGGVQPRNIKREAFINNNVDYELEDLQNDLFYTNRPKVVIHDRRTIS